MLREPLLTDAPAIQILRSDKTVNKYLNRPEKTSLQEAELFLENIRRGMNAGEAYYWIITPVSLPEKVMGTICLWNLNKAAQSAEIGFELLPCFHGKGFMQEAVQEIINYGHNLLHLKVITAFVHKENNASVKLLLKNKFCPDETGKYNTEKDTAELSCFYLCL
ncbi:MAG: GNAT family N-acetyltransferase [Lacibacter sp.]